MGMGIQQRNNLCDTFECSNSHLSGIFCLCLALAEPCLKHLFASGQDQNFQTHNKHVCKEFSKSLDWDISIIQIVSESSISSSFSAYGKGHLLEFSRNLLLTCITTHLITYPLQPMRLSQSKMPSQFSYNLVNYPFVLYTQPIQIIINQDRLWKFG